MIAGSLNPIMLGQIEVGGGDADADAFISAATITDPTQQSAIQTLVTSLKTNGIWTKLKAIYPFVGGTASTHKWNLKDPRDLDAAFRMVFAGGITHSANGCTPDGILGTYASTFFIPSVNGLLNSISFSFYSRTNIDALKADIGVNNVANDQLNIYPRYANGVYFRVNSGPGQAAVSSSSLGWFCGNRVSSSETRNSINSTLVIQSTTSGVLNGFEIQLFRNPHPGGGGTSTRNLAFAHIGEGLTDTNLTEFYTAIQTFQTTLGRNV